MPVCSEKCENVGKCSRPLLIFCPVFAQKCTDVDFTDRVSNGNLFTRSVLLWRRLGVTLMSARLPNHLKHKVFNKSKTQSMADLPTLLSVPPTQLSID